MQERSQDATWLCRPPKLRGPQVAGVRLAAGNYSVTPVPAAAFHLYVLCSLNRTTPFTIDLANSTLVLTVRLRQHSSWPSCPAFRRSSALLWCCTMGCDVCQKSPALHVVSHSSTCKQDHVFFDGEGPERSPCTRISGG